MLGLGAVVLVALVVPILILGLLVFRMPVRRSRRHRRGRLRQSGDPRLLEQAHAHRPAGHRLRHDLSRHDHREDPLRGHRPGVFLKPLFSRPPIRPLAVIGGCLECTKAGNGARRAMLVFHDGAKREYAFGPDQGLPDFCQHQGSHLH